mgnify:CR=1 FL=1
MTEDSKVFAISGTSIPLKAMDFYENLIAWIDDNNEVLSATTFQVKLEFFNLACAIVDKQKFTIQQNGCKSGMKLCEIRQKDLEKK